MKFNKKVLIGLLTASCVIAGTFGLAACQGNEDENKKPEVTIGANGNVFVNGEDTGYKVQDENDEGETLTVDYVLQTPDGIFVYYTDGSYKEVPYIVTSLSLSEENKIVLPVTDNISYYTVKVDANAAGLYTFDVGFDGMDSYYKYKFTVNESTYDIGDGWTTSFNAALKEGDNLITVTSNLTAESSATLTLTAIPTGGTLTAGDNSLTITEGDKFYAYTFTAEEDGDYTVTVPAPMSGSFLKVADSQGEVIACCWPEVGTPDADNENMISDPFTVNAGETVTFIVMADCSDGSELEASYSLTINKIVLPTVTVGDTGVEVNISAMGSSVVILNVETAGTYVLTVDVGVNATVLLDETVFDMQNKTLEIELVAGENKITLENQGYFSASVQISLEAKAAA